MSPPMLFAILLLSGLVLLGLELFVPGGVLGAVAGAALLGAAIAGFFAFPAYAPLVALGIVALTALVLVLWLRFFPRTRLGRRMAVEQNLAASKAPPDFSALLGQSGEALSELRPAGFARIGGRRVDVVTQGELIPRGTRVQVVRVDGVRVVVARAEGP